MRVPGFVLGGVLLYVIWELRYLLIVSYVATEVYNHWTPLCTIIAVGVLVGVGSFFWWALTPEQGHQGSWDDSKFDNRPPPKFSPGNYVECIQSNGVAPLKYGGVYKVQSCYPPTSYHDDGYGSVFLDEFPDDRWPDYLFQRTGLGRPPPTEGVKANQPPATPVRPRLSGPSLAWNEAVKTRFGANPAPSSPSRFHSGDLVECICTTDVDSPLKCGGMYVVQTCRGEKVIVEEFPTDLWDTYQFRSAQQ